MAKKTKQGNIKSTILFRLLSFSVIVIALALTTYLITAKRYTFKSILGVTTEWYVSPAGSSSNTGSKESPWDLQTALNHPSKVLPGDTVWVMGGNYTKSYHSHLAGVEGKPITVRAIPGQRAILDVKGVNIWMDNTRYVNFWGLEITQSSGLRDRTDSESDDYTAGLWSSSGNVSSHHVNFINMIIHDTQFSSYGWYASQNNSEFYGGIIYQVGSTDKDHGLYVNNLGASKRIVDNIIIDVASHGIHGYSSKSDSTHGLENIVVEGNIIAQSGSIGYDPGSGNYGSLERNILIGGTSGVIAKSPTIVNNYTYQKASSTATSVNVGYNGGSENARIKDNYLMGGIFQIGGAKTNLSLTGNTIYYSQLKGVSASSYPNNTWTTSRPSGLKKVIRPNKYEPGRANIAIYNWNKTSTVALTSSDLAGVSIKSGDRYELRNAQNYFGDVITGTYDGSAISVPMTGRTVAKPRGMAYTPPTTFPEFGAFVLLNLSTQATVTPQNTITPASTSTPTPRPSPTPTPSATPTPSPTPTPLTLTLNPTGDAYTDQDSPSTNFGTSNVIMVDSDPGFRKAFFKFNLTSLTGKTVTSAKFKLKTTTSTSAGSRGTMDIRQLYDPTISWNEGDINYSNRPKLASTTTATFVPSNSNTWYIVDLTSLVRSNLGTVLTFGIDTSGGDGADFYSRESSYKPELVIVYR